MEDETTLKDILREFDQKIPLLQSFAEASERLTKQILSSENLRVHSVTSRVKERLKLEEKIRREDKNYRNLQSITDVVGVRIITHFEDEVDKIGTVIEREFSIDRENSIDKRKALDPDRFGYLSLHYISTIRDDRCKLLEYRQYAGLGCEIQIRSILQHAWAEIEHDLGYKTGAPVPSPIRRQFSRLAGLLELADIEFTQIRDELSRYAKRVEKDIFHKPTEVELDDVSLSAFVNSDPLVAQVDSELAALFGAQLDDNRDMQKLVQELLYVELRSISQVRNALESRRKTIVDQFREIVRGQKRDSVGRGLSLYHLFHTMVFEKAGPTGLTSALEHFGVGIAKVNEAYVNIFATAKNKLSS
jgi:GTP pyrophosphokinase